MTTIIVSSRDGAPLPRRMPAGAVKLLAQGAAAGWTVWPTYALSAVSDRLYKNGTMAKPGHYVHSVAVRLARGTDRAWAVWRAEAASCDIPARGWKFADGWAAGERCGARSIVERITS